MAELITGILRFTALAGLMAMAGPIVFDGWIVTDPGWRREFRERSRRLVMVGGLLLLAASLAGGLWTTWGVTDGDPAAMGRYLLLTRGGRGTVLRAAVGLVAALAAARHWPAAGQPLRGWLMLPVAGALAFAWNSHAGVQGPAAVATDFVHIVASSLWIGGLWRFALLPWRRLPAGMAAGLTRRFSTLGALAVAGLAGTGLLTAYRNIYGAEALTRSPYGQALTVKLALIAVLLAIATINLFGLRPLLERRAAGNASSATAATAASGDAGPRPPSGPTRGAALEMPGGSDSSSRPGQGPPVEPGSRATAPPPDPPGTGPVRALRRWVVAEAVAAAGVLLAAAIMSVLPPAERPAALNEPRVWRVQMAGQPLELVVQPGERGAVTLMARPLGRARPARGTVGLDMPEHPMGNYVVTLNPRNGRLEGQAALPMAGRWRLAWTLADAGGTVQRYVTDVEAAGAPGNQRKGRLSLAAAFQSTATALQAGLALAGMLEAAVLVVIGWRRLLPIAFGGGVVAFVLGAWLLGQVAWIDAYPTTFVPNPLPATPAVIGRGREVYMEHCAACHGPAGRGDGPASAGLLPPPADLTGVHARQHTDGDLYWWITNGIEGTAMPAFRERLSEEERWAVVHFIRRLGKESGYESGKESGHESGKQDWP